ncbi:glycosyltransferase family 4 protein [Mesonia ostreae]|uniref:Glycosyltransferase family 4 protein n=1 Tax=Mesonia ostreae TaxID=861110 RepID=A0ABU2KM30_9FLAO|nr:glycosyltransferase family 4 protein [Mesonia ostreae]MDT0295759.1 glycosyltransferase family 4 protein [Mesonia ostreae]
MCKSKNYKNRILFAISNLTYGGIQTQALNLAKAYKNKGCKVYFFYTGKYEEDFVNNELLANNFLIIDGSFINDKNLMKFSWKLQRYWPLVRAVAILKFHRIKYVIPYQNQLSCFFGAIHNYTGVKKTLFHIRSTVLENESKPNWYLKHALQNKPTIIVNSNHARIKFEQVYGKEYDLDIQTIYNGIDVRPIDKTINWRLFFNVESVDFTATILANFFNEKDFLTVFRAWKSFMEKTNSNSKLLIAGDEGVKGMKSFYKKEVENMGLENSVVFLGRISQNIELLSIANCNILSTENEGLPNSVIETLAMGKPFLGTDVDGIREVVGETYPIPLFKIGDHNKLEENLIKIYKDEIDLEYVKKYSFNRFKMFKVNKLIKNYSSIIAT